MTTRFTVSAAAESETLPRLINHFALRGLVPSRVVAEHLGDELCVVIDHPTLDHAMAFLIQAKMESCVLVTKVIISSGTEILKRGVL